MLIWAHVAVPRGNGSFSFTRLVKLRDPHPRTYHACRDEDFHLIDAGVRPPDEGHSPTYAFRSQVTPALCRRLGRAGERGDPLRFWRL